jgi:GNAT superfamily N-acetyltransferase
MASLEVEKSNVGTIKLCYVSPSCLRKGVGAKIIEGLESYLYKLNVKIIQVDSSLSAVNFYLALGYAATSFNEKQPMSFSMIKQNQ